jgi:EAL domain-containing protein (putative c-di-GMP-specific phosphodiesterase class I)
VVEQVCQRLGRWKSDPGLGTVGLGVNISLRQLHEADFVTRVLQSVEANGADAARLHLELTESMLADDIEATIGKMEMLSGAGIALEMDDFGTGYSSLNYLKRLPLTTLKIDQSFVRDIDTDRGAAAIVEIIIALGKKLGLSIIAEGVENEAQRTFLDARDCHAFQGYLLGKPMPIEQFETQFGGQPLAADA